MAVVTSANLDAFNRAELAKKSPPEFDNQGKSLKGVKSHFDYLAKISDEGSKRATEAFHRVIADVPLPAWTDVKGVRVLRSGDSDHVGVPRNGKETAAKFDIINLPKQEHVATMKSNEVHSWLHATAKNEFEEKTGRTPGQAKEE
jgi:hypothetical protein